MRRLAMGSSAQSFDGSGSAGSRPFGRSLATRGLSGDGKGSGAPSGRRVAASLALFVVLLLALAVAPAAQAATKQVINAFGTTSVTPALGGAFASASSGIGGSAVNNQTGDIYVADRGNNRIQQFSASGTFIRAWGQDVVQAGGTGDVSTTAFEICTVASQCKAGITTVQTGGALSAPQGVAVDQATGNVYVTNQNLRRIEEYSSSGTFIRAFGQGVVLSGPDDANAKSAKQTVTIAGATSGTFTLSFRGKTTAPIAWNATAAELKSALEAISTIGVGSVTVTGGPGDVAALAITFAGGLANTPVPAMTADNSALSPLGATATIATEAGQTGYEICNVTDVCTTGTVSGAVGGGALSTMGYPAVVPTGAASGGNVLVPDTGNLRMQEFSSTGAFVRAFGADVVNVGTDNGGAANEVQKLTVAAISGTFTLTFGAGTTAALPYNASASEVEAALNALATIGGAGGFVTVTGGPGNASGSSPYVITFGGSKGGADVAQISINTSGLGASPGAQLSCVGAGQEPLKSLTYKWLRNGVAIGGATASTYTTVAADEGKAIQCQVTTSDANEAGATTVSTVFQVVSPYPGTTLPAATAAPAATIKSGTLSVGGSGGAVVGCSTGTWTGSPTFGFQWYLNGVALSGNGAGTNEYTVQTVDLAKPGAFQCVVAGTNVGGVTSRASGNLSTSPGPNPIVFATATLTPAAIASTTTPGVSTLEVCLPANDTCKNGVAGSGAGMFGSGGPTRVAVDSSGAIYTIDPGNLRVQKFTPAATAASTFAGGILTGTFSNSRPTDVAVDVSNDNVYVARGLSNGEGTPPSSIGELRIFQFDSSANLVDTHATLAELQKNNTGLAVSSSNAGAGAGRIYLSTTTSPSSPKQQVLVLGTLAPPIPAVTSVTGVEAHAATFNGTVNPNGFETKYSFEYSSDGGANWSVVGTPASVGGGTSPVPVTQTATGLLSNIEYKVRLNASKSFNPPTYSASQSFTTLGAAPEVSLPKTDHIVAGSSSVTLLGDVDPNYALTKYYFEYGETAAYGSTAPSPEKTVPGGGSKVPVRQVIEGLIPGTTYHLRLVAHNASGETKSSDATFTIPLAGQSTRGYELVTPADGLAYDVAGPLPSYRLDAWQVQTPSTPNGNAVLSQVRVNGSFPPMILDGDSVDPIVSVRTATGWDARAPLGEKTLSEAPGLGLSDDGSRSLVSVSNFPPGYNSHDKKLISPKDSLTGEILDMAPDQGKFGSLYAVQTADDQATWVSGKYDESGQLTTRTVQGLGGNTYLGGSPDLSAIYFATSAGLLPGLGDNNGNFVYRHDAAGTVLVSHTYLGAPGAGVAQLYSPNAVSAAGDSITFGMTGPGVAADTNAAEDVYQFRHTGSGEEAIWASNTAFTGPAQTALARIFQGASVDGKKIYFTTAEKMVGDGTTTGDLNTVNDIYEYDEGAPLGSSLTRVSVMDPSCSSSPGTCNDNLSNTGATNTSAAKFSLLSDDGSHVFFISGNVLNPADTDTQQSLYVRNTVANTTTYIAPAGAGASSATIGTDSGSGTAGSLVVSSTVLARRPIRVSADGTVAAFLLATDTALPAGRGGVDNDGARDLYVWTESDGLRRVPQGPAVDANTATVSSLGCLVMGENLTESAVSCRGMSADGSQIYFHTTDPLVSADINGGVVGSNGCETLRHPSAGCDVYAYNSATHTVSLISAGDGAPSAYADNDDSGNNVFFYTGDSLDPSRDEDGGHFDIYDARVGGGFPPVVKDPGCDPLAEECQGEASKSGSLPTPQSRNASGAGNPPTPPPNCGKGKVRKHGKCVKKQKKKQHKKQSKKHQKRAGNNSGGGK